MDEMSVSHPTKTYRSPNGFAMLGELLENTRKAASHNASLRAPVGERAVCLYVRETIQPVIQSALNKRMHRIYCQCEKFFVAYITRA